jgi:hypothetical protein
MIRSLIITLAAAMLITRPAYAYIDPGTASIILQGIVGGVAAVGIVFRSHLGRLVSRLRAWRGDKGSDDPASQEDDDGD